MADHAQVQGFTTAEAEPIPQLIDSHDQRAAFTFAGSGDTTDPVIGSFDPAVGTPLERNDPVSFSVTDETALRRVAIFVTHNDQTLVVHDGDSFRGEFSNYSSRAVILNGWRYSVRRNGGWITAATFEVIAIDTSGNEA